MSTRNQVDSLGYAALLSLDSGVSTGSGFQIVHGSKKILVTAKHVLFNERDELRCQSLVISFQTVRGHESDVNIIGIEEINLSNILFSRQNDLAIILLAERQLSEDNFIYKDYITVYQDGDVVNTYIDSSETKLLSDVVVGNNVFLIGYPTSLFFQNVQYFDISKPLLRKGIIAGLNTRGNTFIVDCPAYYGNSGAPIVEVCEDGILRVVGFVSRYVPFVVEWRNSRESVVNTEYLNSGYSVCVPMDAIYALISQF